jgi:hypothetical protein
LHVINKEGKKKGRKKEGIRRNKGKKGGRKNIHLYRRQHTQKLTQNVL